MKRYLIISCFVLSWYSLSYGIYYRIPYFARPASLGEAYVSISDDASTIFYNPAGLNTKTVSFSLTEWFLDTRAGSFAGSYNYKDNFTLGAGLNYFSYGQLQYFDEQGNAGDYFTASFWQAKISVSTQIGKIFSFGFAPKLISKNIDYISENKAGFDIGIIKTIDIFNIGFCIRDLGIDELYDLGLSANPINNLLLTGNLKYQEQLKFGFGAEYKLQPIFIRIGYNNGFACGVGYAQQRYCFDYALCDYGQLGLTHQFSITIK